MSISHFCGHITQLGCVSFPDPKFGALGDRSYRATAAFQFIFGFDDPCIRLEQALRISVSIVTNLFPDPYNSFTTLIGFNHRFPYGYIEKRLRNLLKPPIRLRECWRVRETKCINATQVRHFSGNRFVVNYCLLYF